VAEERQFYPVCARTLQAFELFFYTDANESFEALWGKIHRKLLA